MWILFYIPILIYLTFHPSSIMDVLMLGFIMLIHEIGHAFFIVLHGTVGTLGFVNGNLCVKYQGERRLVFFLGGIFFNLLTFPVAYRMTTQLSPWFVLAIIIVGSLSDLLRTMPIYIENKLEGWYKTTRR